MMPSYEELREIMATILDPQRRTTLPWSTGIEEIEEDYDFLSESELFIIPSVAYFEEWTSQFWDGTADVAFVYGEDDQSEWTLHTEWSNDGMLQRVYVSPD